jgi:hypothetical protein
VEFKLHVGLSAGKPYLTDGNVAVYYFNSTAAYLDCAFTAFAYGRKYSFPASAGYYSISANGKFWDTDGYFTFSAGAGPENTYRNSSLENHIITENCCCFHRVPLLP